jgi:hypothetical protein
MMGRVSFNGGVGVRMDGGAEGNLEDNDLRNNAKVNPGLVLLTT